MPAIDQLDKMRAAIGGITVTTVTPFAGENLDLDEAGARKNLEFLRGSGISAVVPAGNTGEFHTLSNAEIERLVTITVETIGTEKAVFVGVGGELRSAIALAEMAEAAGATGIMIHEPSHTFASEAGQDAYYRAIASKISIGIALYKRSQRLPDPLLRKLAAEVPNIIAIKYAWNDPAAYLDFVLQAPEGVVCACGSAERWALPFAIAGTTGYTSGIGNFNPASTAAFWEALKTDPRSKASHDGWKVFAAIEELRASKGAAMNVPVVKRAMELSGLAGGPPRPPLAPVSDAETETIKELIAAL